MEGKNLDIYGNEPIPWERALAALEAASPVASWWLATTRPYGRPHCTGVGARWFEGVVYVVSGAATRKSRNLAENPNCVVSASLPGLDLAIEGTAARVTDQATLERIAALYSEHGWPATVSDVAFTAPYSAPSAGPPPWDLYAITPGTAYLVATAEPYGATRWRFD